MKVLQEGNQEQFFLQELNGQSGKHESCQSGSKSSSLPGPPCQHASAWLVPTNTTAALNSQNEIPLWGA